MKMRLKRFFRDNSFTAASYKKLRIYLVKRKLRIRNKKVTHKGVKVVHLLQKILKRSDVNFFFDMGTLLGIVREGRLLSHDLDIDIAIQVGEKTNVENIIKNMTKNGCVHLMRLENEEIGVVEDTLMLNDIKFDLSYYFEENGKDVCYLGYYKPEKIYGNDEMDLVKLECEHVAKIEEHFFGGEMVNVPQNAEAYLACRYGENWRTPDRNYIYYNGPSTQKVPYVAKRTIVNKSWIMKR